MSNRRFEMFTIRQILVRMRQGDTDRSIARAGLMGRKKLGLLRQQAAQRDWLDPQQPLPEDAEMAAALQRHPAGPPTQCVSRLKEHEERIATWVAQGIQGTTIHAALVRQHGFDGSYSAVKRLIRQLRAAEAPRVTSRLTFAPGEAVQVDFGAGPLLADPRTGELRKTWFFVMTLCWSRHQYAEFVWDQKVMTWLACHRHAFTWFGGVPERVIIDNAKCAITKACINDPEVQRAYGEYAEGYAFRVDPCPPHDPQKKGIVESGVKYLKRSFLPLREFRHRDDAQQQLQAWVLGEAGNRIHGTTRQAPLNRFAEVEKALLQPLPEHPPEISEWARPKVHRDGHVQYGRCYYSVPFRFVDQRLWLRATPTTVRIYWEQELVATHPRLFQPGSFATVKDHLPPEAQAWQTQDIQWCLRMAEGIGPHCHAVVHQLFADRQLVYLRSVQNLLRLRVKYSPQRLENACARALHYGNARYKSIAEILKKGLDQEPLPPVDTPDNSTYTRGGRFLRDSKHLFH